MGGRGWGCGWEEEEEEEGGDGGSEVSPRCCSIGALMPPFIDFEEHHRVAQDRDNTLLQEVFFSPPFLFCTAAPSRAPVWEYSNNAITCRNKIKKKKKIPTNSECNLASLQDAQMGLLLLCLCCIFSLGIQSCRFYGTQKMLSEPLNCQIISYRVELTLNKTNTGSRLA